MKCLFEYDIKGFSQNKLNLGDDNDNEKNITSLIKEIAQDKTAIIIAHKLSTIIEADNIYFLENGAVAESGTHQELMKMNGSYARIYKNQ